MEGLLASVNIHSLDPQNFVDERLFSFLLHHEVHKATRLQYPLSLLCLSPDLGSSEAPPALTNRLARAASRHVRTTDVGSLLPPSSIALLLIDAEARHLRGILQRLRDALPLSLAETGRERHFTLSAGGGCYPQTAPTANALLQQVVDLMTRAQAEGGNRLHLAPSS